MKSFEPQSAQANKMDENPARRRSCFKFIDLFLEKGPIHGLPYIGKKLLTVLERLLWSVLTLVALFISIHLALESINKFKTKSTVISVEKDYHYWNTTLPSLTICPMNRLSPKRFKSYCEARGIPEPDRSGLFNFLESLANSTYFNFENIVDPPNIQPFIHDPNEVMQFQKHKVASAIPFEFPVKMLEIVASDEFRKENTIEQRKCRFPSESNLKHFPIYTNNLCEQQCRINFAYKLCKCIPHFYPNLHTKTPVCHYRVLKECISKYKVGFENFNLMELVSNHSIQCDCLPNCRIMKLLEAIWQPLGKSEALIGNGGCVISKVFPRIRYRRQTIFTLTDLLVSIGGNAGFFLGFSVLSAVEIVYYFSVRLFWHCLGYRE